MHRFIVLLGIEYKAFYIVFETYSINWLILYNFTNILLSFDDVDLPPVQYLNHAVIHLFLLLYCHFSFIQYHQWRNIDFKLPLSINPNIIDIEQIVDIGVDKLHHNLVEHLPDFNLTNLKLGEYLLVAYSVSKWKWDNLIVKWIGKYEYLTVILIKLSFHTFLNLFQFDSMPTFINISQPSDLLRIQFEIFKFNHRLHAAHLLFVWKDVVIALEGYLVLVGLVCIRIPWKMRFVLWCGQGLRQWLLWSVL